VNPPPITYIPIPTGALGPGGAVLLVSTEDTPGVTTTTLWFGAFSVISQATPEPSARSAPLAGTTVYTAPFIYPMPYGAWSPDGQLLAAEDESNATVRVFTTDYHQVWAHPGRFAAWVGPASLAVLVTDPNDPTHCHLSIYYVQTTGPLPLVGSAQDLPGTYLPFMLAAPDGELAVLTGGDAVGPGFVLVNPQPGPAYDGYPLAWSPDGRFLAFGVTTDRLRQDTLSILDVTSGTVHNTGLQISDQGVTWDRTSTKLLVGLISGAESAWHPALVDVASGTVTNSPIEGEMSAAWQLPDGRWVISAVQMDLWDPSQPGQVVPLGDRIAVSPLGAVVVFEPGSGESPVPLPSLPGVQLIHIAEPMPDFWAFSPDGSHFAYTEASGTQMQLKIATLSTGGG